jgi:hypothetical protein
MLVEAVALYPHQTGIRVTTKEGTVDLPCSRHDLVKELGQPTGR